MTGLYKVSPPESQKCEPCKSVSMKVSGEQVLNYYSKQVRARYQCVKCGQYEWFGIGVADSALKA